MPTAGDFLATAIRPASRRAMVDDWGDWLCDEVLLPWLQIDGVCLIVVAYLGSIVFDDPTCREFRMSNLSRQTRKGAALEGGLSPVGYCRYCALPFGEHMYNRPPIDQEFFLDESHNPVSASYSRQSHRYVGAPFNVQACHRETLRCPIQRCADPTCGRLFVKVRWNHLCTRCHVRWLGWSPVRRLWRPIHAHQYVDELWSADRRHWSAAVETYSAMVRSSNKSGARMVSHQFRFMDALKLQQLMRAYSARICVQCQICQLLFRLPYLVPPQNICGFCKLPSISPA